MQRRPLKDRFWDKVSKQPGDGCWLWMGAINCCGYGTISVDNKSQLAHRVSAQLHSMPIEHWQMAAHTCPVRHCVRPEHLRIGTKKEIYAPKRVRVAVHVLDKGHNLRHVLMPAKQAQALLARRAKQKAKARKRRICLVCGASMRVAELKRRQVTCSKACWLARYRARRPDTARKMAQVCGRRGCDNKVAYRPHKKNAKYCSEACRTRIIGLHLRRIRTPQKPIWHIESCVVCRDWFITKRIKGSNTCGGLCKAAYIRRTRQGGDRARPLPKNPTRTQALCVMCGSTFVQSPHPKFTCSTPCSRLLHKETLRRKKGE